MNSLKTHLCQIKISEIMNDNTASVNISTSSSDAAKMMEDNDVGTLIVLEHGLPVGIITDRDFSIKITAHSFPVDTPVRRIMSSPIISINSSSNLLIASDLMSSNKIRTLPVIDDDNVIGIITISDLMNHLITNIKSDLNSL